MNVERIDPSTIGAADVAACLEARNAAVALDRPDAPPQSEADFRAWLGQRSADARCEYRLVRDGGGLAVGLSHLLLTLTENVDQVHLRTWVHPDHRRQGAGTALLADAVDLARAEGRRVLVAGTVEGSAGARFAERYGLPCRQREQLSLLDLSTVDREFLGTTLAAPHPPYRLEHWCGPVPEEWLERFCVALKNMADAPLGDLEWEEPSHSPRYVRTMEAWARTRGRAQHITVAVHEPTAAVAGLTWLYLPTDPDGRAYQDDTTVAREHRGHGLGLWMKADTTLRLLTDHPEVKDVITGNAADNEYMLAVNRRLGFRPAQVEEARQATVEEVAKLLG